MQQRMRVAADSIQKDLVMAGAGTYSGFMVGTLDNYFAPMLPHRVGTIAPDPAGSFRANALCPTRCASAITIMYVPNTTAQTTISNRHADAVGRAQGASAARMRRRRPRSVRVQRRRPRAHLRPERRVRHLHDHQRRRTTRYTCSTATTSSRRSTDAGAWITHVESHTYYLNEVPATNTYELRHYDGYQTDLPVADNVVDFRIEFFGDPLPPQLVRPGQRPGGPLDDVRPEATGHRSTTTTRTRGATARTASSRSTARPACRSRGRRSRRSARRSTGRCRCRPAMLTDGPWCPAETNTDGDAMPNKFDADLLRVRQVRVTLRVQVANDLLRGPAGVLFRHGGALEQRRAVHPGPGSPFRCLAAQHEPGTLRQR